MIKDLSDRDWSFHSFLSCVMILDSKLKVSSLRLAAPEKC